ncbi:hypothetical protein HK097_008108 [Rhizophlyctis rosea]|uniref:Uncharacterized protein n=1 Tax=Rhizophlyctis rosea TaxID=64517 RepID=A0AAD5SAR5_9FUNG|nr:hypothetical protein HK097_008108 [Rhizophlyctis rosea]
MVYIHKEDDALLLNANAPRNPIIKFDIILDNKDVPIGGHVKGKVAVQMFHEFKDTRQLAIKFEGLKVS